MQTQRTPLILFGALTLLLASPAAADTIGADHSRTADSASAASGWGQYDVNQALAVVSPGVRDQLASLDSALYPPRSRGATRWNNKAWAGLFRASHISESVPRFAPPAPSYHEGDSFHAGKPGSSNTSKPGEKPKVVVPELDPGATPAALTLLLGGALVVLGRRRRQQQ